MDLLVCIYLAGAASSYRAFITHNPNIDAAFLFSDDGTPQCMDLLTPYIPIGIADYILKSVFTEEEITGRRFGHKPGKNPLFKWFLKPGSYEAVLQQKYRKIKALFAEIASAIGYEQIVSRMDDFPVRVFPERLKPGSSKRDTALLTGSNAVSKSLEGRILFYEEIQKSLGEHGFGQELNLLDILQILALQGKVRIFPAIGITSPGTITCFRCGIRTRINFRPSFRTAGERSANDCPVCGFPSINCTQCSDLGESRLCRGLYAMGGIGLPGDEKAGTYVGTVGVPPLTPAQARASTSIKQFVKSKKTDKCLLWAAAGAGKTEVVLEAMAEVVRCGGRVLYTAPRRDVVIEIAPRLQNAFRELTVKAVYGGSPERFVSAPIIAATVHQVLRFYHTFDLIVFDEVDAYPYKDNHMLEMAIRRSLKPEGQIVYMTATPSRELLLLSNRGKAEKAVIPARYHGYPVPEPLFLKKAPFVKRGEGEMRVEEEVIRILLNWLNVKSSQIFVFLPTIEMVERYGPLLKKALVKDEGNTQIGAIQTGAISSSHAKDPFRDDKRERFKSGETRVFITTSIMERGITVPNAYVLVLEADFEPVYDEGTLIQMAGRAGRSAEFPHGEVVFAAKRISGAMKSAKDKISYLNNEARQHGYLRPGW